MMGVRIPGLYNQALLECRFLVHPSAKTAVQAIIRQVCTRKLPQKAVLMYIPGMYSARVLLGSS